MNKMYKYLLVAFSLALLQQANVQAQKKDTSINANAQTKKLELGGDTINIKKDTLAKKKHDPNKATVYSAIFPGLGQVYNKKYWKLPIVYAAVGIPVYTFFYNRSWYNKTKYALAVVANGSYNNPDSLGRVDPKLLYFVQVQDATDLIKYRDEFRKDEDYSVLFFLLFYALQIVDATVDAHLKDFNVNNDLSFHIKPNAYAASGNFGISLVFDIHKPGPKPLFNIYK
ncbi:MAG: hypothetical protein JST47_08700 [Bacteroidetes bacterium]|nr:hypothetical protein [Bacteroidota bacterium]MBS1975412.1 hypothetical protein [Bacteroidota bacterium]